MSPVASALIASAQELSKSLAPLRFAPPVTHVYNPLVYASAPHELYLEKYARPGQQVVFLGMNPGPYGMTQTGVPFGEIAAVRDWMGIVAPVRKPARENPKRPVVGFDCVLSEVSGRRLWGLFASRFKTADAFFNTHFVANYCPLVFMEEGGKNRTPDKLPAAEMAALYAACDLHLKRVIEVLEPKWLVGVGGFAESRALPLRAVFPEMKIGRILHPSPASPAANKDWAGNVTRTLESLGIW